MTELHAFKALIKRHIAPADRSRPTNIPGVSVMYLDAPARPARKGDDLLFYMVVNGRKVVRLGEAETILNPGDYIVSNADLDIISEIPTASPDEPYLGVVIKIDPMKAMSTARSLGLKRSDAIASRYIGGNGGDNGLVDATYRLLALLEQQDDIPSLAPLLEQEIIYRLLRSDVSLAFVELISLRNRKMRINAAIEAIAHNYCERLDIVRLAKSSGMSTASLYRQFKAATQMSPGQYQKKVRLREARRLMLEGTDTVAAAALKVGYASPSQFSREYKRAYGRAPLRDITVLRSSNRNSI